MSALPTAWLAPPDHLSSAHHSTNIAPVPLAISGTVAVIIGIAVTLLFFRKDKEVFLEDRMPDVSETKPSTTIAEDVTRHSSHAAMYNTRRTHHPSSKNAMVIRGRPSFELQPKLDDMLGIKDQYPKPEHAARSPQLPLPYQAYLKPSYVDDQSDGDTLQDDEKNSAYVPYPSSEASDDTYRYGKGRLRRASDLQVLDDESMSRRSPSFESRSNLGDAY